METNIEDLQFKKDVLMTLTTLLSFGQMSVVHATGIDERTITFYFYPTAEGEQVQFLSVGTERTGINLLMLETLKNVVRQMEARNADEVVKARALEKLTDEEIMVLGLTR